MSDTFTLNPWRKIRAKKQQKDDEDAGVALLVAFDGIEDGVRNVDAIFLPSMGQGCQKF